MSFTPGPWIVCDTPLGILIQPEGSNNTICEFAYGDDRDESNAKLIAAAPLLYEALRSCFVNGDPSDEFAPGDLSVQMIRAALAEVDSNG